MKNWFKKTLDWAKQTKLGQWWISTPLIEQRQNTPVSAPIRWRASTKFICRVEPREKTATSFEPYLIPAKQEDYGTFDSYQDAEAALPPPQTLNRVISSDPYVIMTLESVIPVIQSV